MSSNTSSSSVGPTKHVWTRDVTTGHVIGFTGRVNYLVNSSHGEVKCHELTTKINGIKQIRNHELYENVHWMKALERSANRQTSFIFWMSLFSLNWLSEADNGKKSKKSDRKRRKDIP